ncbi:MAG TPA: alanine racemase [Acidimicrobiia bacterium]|nr:alanine racemase [Acidimicrobiia bacterium]
MRPTWMEVDLAAIRANAAALVTAFAPAALCAVVKADGYGHGDVPSAEAALEGGAARLAVALVAEGARLREADIEAPILLLSEPEAEDAAEVVRWGLTPTVYRPSFLDALERVAPPGFPVQVKVDTGMHRVGAPPALAADLARRVAASPLHLQGIWTHFAAAEEDPSFTADQMRGLQMVMAALAAEGIHPEMVHAANTAAGLAYPDARLDLVRAGIGVFGLRPAPGLAPALRLRPAMRIVSRVAYLQRLPAGARPSYGRRRPLPQEATVATIPMGYADGVPRRLAAAGGRVLIGGRRHPFAGSITMDQIVVDVGDDEVRVGDEVVLIGRQGREEVTADDWAVRLGVLNYEVVCGFGPRLPRRYLP